MLYQHCCEIQLNSVWVSLNINWVSSQAKVPTLPWTLGGRRQKFSLFLLLRNKPSLRYPCGRSLLLTVQIGPLCCAVAGWKPGECRLTTAHARIRDLALEHIAVEPELTPRLECVQWCDALECCVLLNPRYGAQQMHGFPLLGWLLHLPFSLLMATGLWGKRWCWRLQLFP